MIPFKNLKYGFSFIEIMIALALLGIFGSSIFLVQNNIFSKIFKTHQSLFFNQDIIYDSIQLKNKIHLAVLEKQSVDSITIQESRKNPDRKMTIKLLPISSDSELKSFSKNLRIVQSSATYNDQRTIQWFNFIYIPKLTKEEEKSPKAKTV